MKLRAKRNIRLCTKDCLCLYVCPTGASDTEDGQVDASKCIGCGMCAQACPSHAISMVPYDYPPQQTKDTNVLKELSSLIQSKLLQESIAKNIAANSNAPLVQQFAKAIAKSNRLMNEDIIRESGYMLPQSLSAKIFLERLLKQATDDIEKNIIREILSSISCNEEKN